MQIISAYSEFPLLMVNLIQYLNTFEYLTQNIIPLGLGYGKNNQLKSAIIYSTRCRTTVNASMKLKIKSGLPGIYQILFADI